MGCQGESYQFWSFKSRTGGSNVRCVEVLCGRQSLLLQPHLQGDGGGSSRGTLLQPHLQQDGGGSWRGSLTQGRGGPVFTSRGRGWTNSATPPSKGLLGPSRGAEVIKSVECEDEPDIGLDKSEGMLGSEGQEVERGMGELEA